MDPIKEAFARAKQDVDSLRMQIMALQGDIIEIKATLKQLQEPTNQPTHTPQEPSNTPLIPTHNLTELSNQPYNVVKSPYRPISTGNDGVPTDQPTNQPTNQRTGNEGVAINANVSPTHNPPATPPNSRIEHLARVSEILASLDGLKKEVRLKFKRLTDQEMVVFTKIYELDDGGIDVTYEVLAASLNLTAISIRDYVGKIIKKGIPIDKKKENNKRILLSISNDLKRIASLQTINQLREL